MSEVLRCDQCKAIREDSRSVWHTLQPTFDDGYTTSLHFCSLKCLRDWADAAIVRREQQAQRNAELAERLGG